jgi:MoaA/NifB/PqqE/SkfB family radical SAM enzyme
MSVVAEAVASDRLGGRVWLYSNYHCNLACTYCLTESAPSAARRELDPALMLRAAHEAARLGFTDLGVTGGEPFLLPSMPALLADLAEILPTLVLSNGTLFGEGRLARLAPLIGRPVAVQISLDAPDPATNDAQRGDSTYAKVVDAIPRLVDLGIRVRVATTLDEDGLDDEGHARLCELHRSLGVPDEDHIVRPVLRRGRAGERGRGTDLPHSALPPELTLTTDGAFWSPFGPTVRQGALDTDLLVTRTILPLDVPACALLELVDGLPRGADARIGIR